MENNNEENKEYLEEKEKLYAKDYVFGKKTDDQMAKLSNQVKDKQLKPDTIKER